MEADVALHTPETWASGSEQRSDKIKYVYSNRRKDRETKSARKASRLQQIKPSRSYDNDIEASAKEPGVSQPPPVPKTKDDSSMRYGERPSRQPGRSRELGYSGIPTASGSPCASRKSPHVSGQGGSLEIRWKPKDRKQPARERRKNSGCESPRYVEKQNSLPESSGYGSQIPPKSLKFAKSVDDSLPSRSELSSPQSILLEVKDGPSIRYKPSQTMLSDDTELDSCGEVKSPRAVPLDSPSSIERLAAIPRLDQSKLGASSDNDHSRLDYSRVCPDDRPLPALQKIKGPPPEQDTVLFHNVSEASQRRYGVKHDDIVVGPAAHKQFERPSELPPFDSVQVSDEAAFSSISLLSQQKAGVCHDDIVVGPNAKRQKAAAQQSRDNQSKTSPGLPPIPHSGSKITKSDQISPIHDSSHPREEATNDRSEMGSKSVPHTDSAGCSNTLERESRIPKLAERAPEQRQRGASPGSSIPVFRQARSVDKSQGNSRGASPAVSDTPGSRVRTPVSLEDEGKSDRSYGSVDRVKWRPKPNKSGLHRMKRVAKREANVSTESGYATDQMPSSETGDLKISPQHCSDSRDRFHRKSGSCNDIDKDLEEIVLDSIPVKAGASSKKQNDVSSPPSHSNVPKSGSSKSRSKSSHKQTVEKETTKPNMLSNIPVPVGYDEPPGKCLETPSHLPAHHKLPHNSQIITTHHQSTLPSEGPITENDPSLCQQRLADSQNHQQQPLLSTIAPKSNTPPLSLTTQDAIAPPPATSTATTPIKPRLHRSAEHLVGHSKLSVFRSKDNGKHQPDSASDVSTSTSSSTKTSRSLQDPSSHRQKHHSKQLDVLATPKRSGTPVKGRSVSMLRKESERSVAIVRRGSDRAIPVSRHDPSVQDLKAATSHKELCQSMASLLHIDNEKAAEMLSTSLSKRRDLVEGLDADAILDYLTHHGVLDPSVLVNLKGAKDGEPPSTIQRNSAILRHVEEHGDTAVALFINALRQSGQLHLASSLDTEQRIKPMCGEGYLDKPRHKGEIVVRLSVEALKILAPRDPPSERNVNLHLLTSTYGDQNLDMVDTDEDEVKSKSCWCFCMSRKRRNRSSSSKKGKRKNRYGDQQLGFEGTMPTAHNSQLQHEIMDPAYYNFEDHIASSSERNFGGTNHAGGSKTSTSLSSPSCRSSSAPADSASVKEKRKKNKKKTKNSGKPYVPETAEEPSGLSSVPDHVLVNPRSEDKSTDKTKKSSKQLKHETKKIPRDLNLSSGSDKRNWTKDTTDGIFMEYDSHLELVKLRACHDELASPTRQAGPVGIMVEQWKSSGKHFLVKSDLLCRAIVEEFLTDIIKYFEQDRGTLVLDVVSEATSVTVFNICMTKNQVSKLEKDHIEGSLLQKLQEVFMSRLDIAKFDIRGVRFCTEVDGNQLKSVLSELS